MNINEIYMRRALQLARCGEARTAPNPMVGAVIVAHNRIIGEGYHRHYGDPHAEVNAIRSVKEQDIPLLQESTIYVTLEPCSHYGKTPPCAKLLIEKGIPRIVIGAEDPFPEVSGRGIKMLRDAGREVICGVLRNECRNLNKRFMLAHEQKRPYVQLKWAQSADGFIARDAVESRVLFSSPLSSVMMHRERARAGAILVGVNTIIADNPRLDCRLWPGSNPLKLSRDSIRIPAESHFSRNKNLLRKRNESLADFLRRLYMEEKILSVMVEGGSITLSEFINADLYDEIRIECSPEVLSKGVKAPEFPFNHLSLADIFFIRQNKMMIFRR